MTFGWVLDCRPVPAMSAVLVSLSRCSSTVVGVTLKFRLILFGSALRIGSVFGSHCGLRTSVAPRLSLYEANLYGPEDTMCWTYAAPLSAFCGTGAVCENVAR